MKGKIYLVAALASAALAGSGCARDEDPAKVATDNAPSTTVTDADDRAQIKASEALAKNGSAAAAALTLVRDVRDGAGPVVLPAYDSRIPGRLGVSTVIGALETVRQITQPTTPVVVRQRRTMSGVLVVLRLLRPEGDDNTYSYFLRRQGGRWVIAYDGLLAEGLQSYVQAARANGAAKPSRAAVKAGARAVAELKLAARRPLARSQSKAKKSKSEPKEPPSRTTPSDP